MSTEQPRTISIWMLEGDAAHPKKEQLIARAQAQISLRKYEEAFKSFEAALKSAPNDPFVWFGKGVVAQQLDRLEDAVNAFERAIELDSTNIQFLAHLGHALALQGHLDRALRLLDEVLAHSPDSLIGLLYKGVALGEVGQKWGEALEYLQRARSLYPDSYQTLTCLVAALAILNRFEEALDACKMALEREPNCPISLTNKAGILSAPGDARQALVTVERALAIDRSHEDAWLTKGTILAGNYCDFPRAMLAFDRAKRFGKTRVENRIVDAWTRAADTLLRRRRTWRAIWCLNCAILYCPQAPSLLTKKGVVLYQDLRLHAAGLRVLKRAKERGDLQAENWIRSFEVHQK